MGFSKSLIQELSVKVTSQRQLTWKNFLVCVTLKKSISKNTFQLLHIDKRIVFCFLIFSMAFIHSIWYLSKFFYFVVYWNLLYKRLAVMSFCDTKFHIFRWRRDYSWCSARVRPRGTKTRRPIRYHSHTSSFGYL